MYRITLDLEEKNDSKEFEIQKVQWKRRGLRLGFAKGKGDTNGLSKAKAAGSKLREPSWTEFIRLAYQAVVACVAV